ncbi:hypothetical protein CAS74_000089 [Pichia kudriavzevii]|uniref:Major facilitator superfamily (MFS) profile domain-containing protein n=1 Tax=Pichia kudriavzevii TaxID=4909 RepID=A0A1Z8JSZ5_PICKU|nr:hypothetical protein CAS74_000089 [Pichia kudriavzevii]
MTVKTKTFSKEDKSFDVENGQLGQPSTSTESWSQDQKISTNTPLLPQLEENHFSMTKYAMFSNIATLGLMAGIITAPQFVETFPAVGGVSHHTTVVQGAVTSCYELGCFFGALSAMYFGGKWGRKRMIMFGCVIIIMGTFISIFPFKGHWALGHFIIARSFTGFGNGFNTATIPVYQSELSDATNRGFMVTFEGCMVAVGTTTAYWIVFGLSYAKGSISWRLPLALQVVYADKIEEARYVLAQLHDTSINDPDLLEEVILVRDANNRFSKRITLKEFFTPSKHQYLNRVLIGSSSQFFQQFTGCNAAIYYSTVLFETTVGLSRRMALTLEINSMRTRTMAASASTCTNWLSNFAVVMFTPIFINRTRWGCYLFFAAMNFIYVPIIYMFYPETAGRSLEEIDIIFAKAFVEKKPALLEGIELGLYEDENDFSEWGYETDAITKRRPVHSRQNTQQTLRTVPASTTPSEKT